MGVEIIRIKAVLSSTGLELEMSLATLAAKISLPIKINKKSKDVKLIELCQGFPIIPDMCLKYA